jgi:hypothetical protein
VKGREKRAYNITTSSSRMGAVFSRIESGGEEGGGIIRHPSQLYRSRKLLTGLYKLTHTGIIYRLIPNMFRILTSLCVRIRSIVIGLPPGSESVRNMEILTILSKILRKFKKIYLITYFIFFNSHKNVQVGSTDPDL